MKIIETSSQFESFIEKYKGNEVLIHPILADEHLHPLNNSISLMFIRIWDDTRYLNGNPTDYVLCFNHSESLRLSDDCIKSLNCASKIYTLNKKVLHQLYPFDNIFDMNMLNYLNTGEIIDISDLYTQSHSFYNRNYYKFKNHNILIPIGHHYFIVQRIFAKINRVVENCNINDIYDIYNGRVLNNLIHMENNGLYVNEDLIGFQNKKHIKDNKVYTEYNPFTTTGRPSNRFGGINFAALNKKDESRKCFISRFNNKGFLIEYDYDAYHLRLIADIIGYKFPKGSVHKYLGEQYGLSYEESKAMSFRLLYGGIDKDIAKSIPFFGKVKEYIDLKWNEYKKSFSIQSDIYNRKIVFKDDMNPNKLFNYLIQLAETENNMNVLSDLISLLETKKSKLVLYQYDSFLLDFNSEDTIEFLGEVKKIMERSEKFPIKAKYGKNYHEMFDFTEKLNEF